MDEIEEFYDAITTIDLAIYNAKIDGRSVDNAIRFTANAVSRRVKNPKTKEVFFKLSIDALASAIFYMMKKQS